MATAGNYDLSASLYVGHSIVVRSRVIMKSDEITMENEQTAFITKSMSETGKNTLSFVSETDYRGGKLFTIVLKTT